jgi:uncharacterized protein YjbI with pentapeptide repeats
LGINLDGTTSATVQIRTLAGVISTDDVSLSGGIATFDTANAGTGKTVTLTGATLTGTTLTGTDEENYTLAPVNTTTADVTKADATIAVSGYTGVYDTAAHQAMGTATGVLGEDLSAGLDLSVTTHTNAGVYIDTVTFTDVTGNYKFTVKNVSSRIL